MFLDDEVVDYLPHFSRTHYEFEDVPKVVKDLGLALGIEVDDSQITAAHRIPTFKKDRPAALIVQFLKKDVKDNWIGKFREAGILTADKTLLR
ncbi:hypothetical protein J6590_065105 [Homalodisca vitripennis]|nr:hypothetical protein J6590_065105 [Homalodisca vitripennis]